MNQLFIQSFNFHDNSVGFCDVSFAYINNGRRGQTKQLSGIFQLNKSKTNENCVSDYIIKIRGEQT